MVQDELRKRLDFPYRWHKKQNDIWDRNSNFIYSVLQWEQLLREIEVRKPIFPGEEKEFFNYSINRWYNFQSAMAIERIFTEIEGIEPNLNSRDRLVDFNFFGIDFDHKTSVFPATFSRSIQFAKENPSELIKWLYKNQSQQQRKHLENRLFVVVYSSNGQHWKLKAEISWLKDIIKNYVATFEASQLMQFEFEPGKKGFSDIIWAIK